jgi:hypothetical protein
LVFDIVATPLYQLGTALRRTGCFLFFLTPDDAPGVSLQVLTGKKARRQRQAAMRERLYTERLEAMAAVGLTPGFWGWLGRTLGMNTKLPAAGADSAAGKSQ